MMYLIVPPIIIVLAVAILIVFLVRILSTNKKGNAETKQKFVNNNKSGKKRKKEARINARFQRSRQIIKEKSEGAAKKIKSKLESDRGAKKSRNITQGIVTGNNVKKIVSLRKKSMVSDKMIDGEDRDVDELEFMKKIENNPQNSKGYECLADYYMEQEKFEDARECYKYVLRLDPRHKRAQVAMKNLDRIL